MTTKSKQNRQMTAEQKRLFKKLSPMNQRVAIYHLSGMFSNRECYVKAGGKAKENQVKDSTVSKILSLDKVVAFLDAMKETMIQESIMSRDEMAKRLTNLSRVGMNDLVEFGEYEIEVGKGKKKKKIVQSVFRVKDSAMQSSDTMASISELTASRDGGIKIKQHSPLQAMKQLSEIQGYNAATTIHINKDEELTPFSDITAGEDKLE